MSFRSVLEAIPLIGTRLRVERQLAGEIVRLERERSWDAAQVNRLTEEVQRLTHTSTADQEHAAGHGRVRNLARQMIRNANLAKSVRNRGREKAIGAAGIMPSLETTDEKFNQMVEELWEEDGEEFAVTGESLWEVQLILANELMVAGEAFLHWGVLEGRFVVDLFEPEQLAPLANVPQKDGEVYQDGILFDAHKRPLKYVIQQELPGALGLGFGRDFVELPGKQVFHAFRKDRPGQTRGVSEFDTALLTLSDLKDANYAEGINIKAGAYFGVIIEKPQTVAGGLAAMGPIVAKVTPSAADTSGKAKPSEKQVVMKPGMVQELDGVPHFLDPSRPGDHYLPFVKNHKKEVAAAAGLTYSEVAGDNSEDNYSSMQAARLATMAATEERQKLLVKKVLRPLFRAWLGYQVGAGRVKLPAGMTMGKVMRGLNWLCPGIAPVNPLDAIEADAKELAIGVKTFSQLCAERGLDPRKQVRARLADEVLLKDLGGVEGLLTMAGLVKPTPKVQVGAGAKAVG